jgi:hypothetical protein
MLDYPRFLRTPSLLVLVALTSACGGEDTPGTTNTGEPRFAVVANVERSAFVGVWDGELSGQSNNSLAFEVGTYPELYLSGKNLIVPQNNSSDEVLRFVLGDDGQLTPQGSLRADPQSQPTAVLFASPEKGYVSCTYSGKLVAFDPNSMTKLGEIDFTGQGFGVDEEVTEDDNPDPGAMALRDGKLYVTLAQKKNQVLSHPGMYVAILDAETDAIQEVVNDTRFAQSGGEIDRIYLDEVGDLYVYGAASYGFDPTQSHGFLRIRDGEFAFDSEYDFDLGALELDVPGGRIDYLNHLIYDRDGVVYAFANVPGLASNPPDYVNDHTFQAVEVNLYEKTVKLLPLPYSNGYSGTIAMDGQTLIAAIAAREGVGFYTYDRSSGTASPRPLVTTVGYVSQLVSLE